MVRIELVEFKIDIICSLTVVEVEKFDENIKVT